MNRVLFACVHNAGRSQMAAGFLNSLANAARAIAISAGTQPAERVHPEVVTAMREVGIDLRGETPQLLTTALGRSATLLVTMGCGDACPFVPGLEVMDWEVPDPKGQTPDQVRMIRDHIRDRVASLVRDRGWA